MSNVKLVWATPDSDKLLAYIARVSNPLQQDKSVGGLFKYMVKEGHTSPFTMANVCMEINAPRDISRQIMRHWSMMLHELDVQEFCVAEGTLVTVGHANGALKKVPIETLYDNQTSTDLRITKHPMLRVFDEGSRTFVRAAVKEVFSTGTKECFEMVLSDGKRVTCTAEHKFLTREGFVPLGDLSIGGLVAVNGQAAYTSSEWMAEAKAASLVKDGGVQHIAEAAGCSYHTIRKWLKRHGLMFTKKETHIVQGEIWNKGLPSSEQPMTGKFHNALAREKMAESSTSGSASPFFAGGAYRALRQRVWDWQTKWRLAILAEHGHKCAFCGATEELEIDHRKPISSHPELAFDRGNLQVLCATCHQGKSVAERITARQTVRWKEIVSITPVGPRATYDLEVDHPSHNYIADGIVSHNSQRYADVSLLPETKLRECRMQDATNRQNSLPCTDVDIAEWWRSAQEETVEHETEKYQKALALGIAKEQARAVLPEGLTPSRFYLNGNYRSWIFFLTWRLHGTAQKEVRDVADEALVILREVAPLTIETFFPLNAPTPEEVCQAAYLDFCRGKFSVMPYSTWQSVWTAARAA